MSLVVQAGLFWAIMVGLPLGIVAAIILLWLFRRRVARSMRETARQESAPPNREEHLAISDRQSSAEASTPRNLTIDLSPTDVVLADGSARPRSAVAAKRQAGWVSLVYGVAVSFAALIMVNVIRIISPLDFSQHMFTLYFMYFATFVPVFAMPVVLVATYVLRKQFRYLLLAVLALLAVIGLWDLFMFKGSLFNLWLWYSAGPTGVALLLITRRLRAVGPVVIVGTAVWSAVSVALIFVACLYALDFVGLHFTRPDLRELDSSIALEKYLAEFGQSSLENYLAAFSTIWSGSGEGRIYVLDHPERNVAAGAIAFATFPVAFLAGAAAARAALSWLASRYRRRRVSDQMLTNDVLVLLFPAYIIMVVVLFSVASSNAAAIVLLSVVAFVLYKLIVIAGLRLLRKVRSAEPARALLLLRVFGFARRTQRLLEDLGQGWRYLGPIRLIAGPDLAYATVEPHELYDFLGGRLSRAFVRNRDDLESRLSQGIAVAAPDGLYPIQDFFCHDDTWRMTVSRLARDVDAIFMDLRGFSPSNRGCIFEIEQLTAWVPLDRIVLLVDQTTDIPLLEQTLMHAWQHLPGDSPNVSSEKPVVRVVEASKSDRRTLNALMMMLCIPFDIAPGGAAEPMRA